jgi:hypothetical protein
MATKFVPPKNLIHIKWMTHIFAHEVEHFTLTNKKKGTSVKLPPLF